MNLSNFDMLLIATAISAIMMLGTTSIRTNLLLYACHTLLIAVITGFMGYMRAEPQLYMVAFIVAVVKAWGVPTFLNWITRRVGVLNDPGAFIPAPLAMHLGIALLGASYMLGLQLPMTLHEPGNRLGGTLALSLISTGMLLMLTRNIAVNQVIGFLVIENGIYAFSLTQTRGMPMAIEMGVLLDVLVGVMIAGLVLFRIKKNFEHIDVSKLTELRD
jgi:hydrogenase-4 component E